MDQKIELVYRLKNINADEGVDIFEIAPILMDFGNLIKSASDVLGLEQKIEVKVKPFKDGSWITEFLIHTQQIRTLLMSPEVLAMEGLLGLLGFTLPNSIKGVATIIRFTKGKVNNFRKSEDGAVVTYTDEQGNKLEVNAAAHKLVQSPLIQQNYYSGVLASLEKFPAATEVEISIKGEDAEGFTEQDRAYFEEYARTELLEEVEQNATIMSGVYIKPKRGSYSGEEKAYSFVLGENVIWPTTIEDQAFLDKVKSGELRLYSEDVLKVDLEVIQKKDSSNRLITQYAIKKVLEYIKYEKPHQFSIDDAFTDR